MLSELLTLKKLPKLDYNYHGMNFFKRLFFIKNKRQQNLNGNEYFPSIVAQDSPFVEDNSDPMMVEPTNDSQGESSFFGFGGGSFGGGGASDSWGDSGNDNSSDGGGGDGGD